MTGEAAGRDFSPSNPVVHFEIPARDTGRKSKFYSAVFGRQTQPLGPEMGNYAVVQTTETGKNNFPKEPGIPTTAPLERRR